MTRLLVERKESELHRAGHSEGHPKWEVGQDWWEKAWAPDAVEHVTIGEYPDVEIGSQDIVKTTDLLISKESVWHPYFGGINQCQIFDLIWSKYGIYI